MLINIAFVRVENIFFLILWSTSDHKWKLFQTFAYKPLKLLKARILYDNLYESTLVAESQSQSAGFGHSEYTDFIDNCVVYDGNRDFFVFFVCLFFPRQWLHPFWGYQMYLIFWAGFRTHIIWCVMHLLAIRKKVSAWVSCVWNILKVVVCNP